MAEEIEETTNGVDPMKKRLSKLTSQRRDALAQVADMEERMEAMEKRAALAEALAARVQELEASSSRVQTEHTRAMALVDAGVTDNEAREFLLHRYARAGDEAADLPDWLDSQRDGATGFMAEVFGRATSTPAEEGTPPTEALQTASKATPRMVDKGAKPTPTGQDSLSVEAILDPNRDFNEILTQMGFSLDPKIRGR